MTMEEEVSIDNFEEFFPQQTPRFSEKASVEALKQTGIDPKELKPIGDEQLKRFPNYPGVRESVEKSLNQRRTEKINQLQFKRNQILNVSPLSKRSEDDRIAELRKKAEKEKEIEFEAQQKVLETMIVNELAILDLKETQEEKEKRRIETVEKVEQEIAQTRRDKQLSLNERSKKIQIQNQLEKAQRDKKKVEMEEKWENESKRINDDEQKRKAAERKLIELKRKDVADQKIQRRNQLEQEKIRKAQEKLEKALATGGDLNKTNPGDLLSKKLKVEEEMELKKKMAEKEESRKKKEALGKLQVKEEQTNQRIQQIRNQKELKLQEVRNKSIEKIETLSLKREVAEKNKQQHIDEMLKKELEAEKRIQEKKEHPDEKTAIEMASRELKAQFALQNQKEIERGKEYRASKKAKETKEKQEKAVIMAKSKAEIMADLRNQTLRNAEQRKKMIDDFNYLASRSDNPDFTPLVSKYGLDIDELKTEAKKRNKKESVVEIFKSAAQTDAQQPAGDLASFPDDGSENLNTPMPSGSSFELFESNLQPTGDDGEPDENQTLNIAGEIESTEPSVGQVEL